MEKEIEILEKNNNTYADSNILDNSTKMYLNEIGKYPLLSKEEQYNLFKKYRNGHDIDAYNKLVQSNLRLSVFVAKEKIKEYENTSFLDLIQEYNIVLMHAVRLFDPERGIEFSTYAIKAMRTNNRRIKAKKDATIKESLIINDRYKKYQRFIMEYKNKYNKFPTKEEIMKSLKITDKEYENLFYKNIRVDSLNKIIEGNDDKDMELINNISDPENLYENKERFIDIQIIKKALYDYLTRKEYYIVYWRIFAPEIKKLEEIGKELEVSRQAINAFEKRIFKDIKNNLEYIQKLTIKTYGIKELINMKLTPLSPKLIATLDYLRMNISNLSYFILYTLICENHKHNIEYYHNLYPYIDINEINEEISKATELYKNIPNISKEIFNTYKEKYTVSEMFELDITPNITYNKVYKK